MEADAKQLAALEEKLKRDLDAIARVRQLIAQNNGSLSPPDSRQYTLPIPISDKVPDVSESDEAPIQSLRGTICKIINEDPNVRWTAQKVMARLIDTGFQLRAKKPIYSIGQALYGLVEKGEIRLVRKGVGSAPNLYKGKVTVRTMDSPANTEDHSGGDTKESIAG